VNRDEDFEVLFGGRMVEWLGAKPEEPKANYTKIHVTEE